MRFGNIQLLPNVDALTFEAIVQVSAESLGQMYSRSFASKVTIELLTRSFRCQRKMGSRARLYVKQ